MRDFFGFGVCFFIAFLLIENEWKLLLRSFFMAFVFFLMYVFYSYSYFEEYKTFSVSSMSNEVRVRELLNDVIKNCLLNSALANMFIFYHLLAFGIIHEEYRWIMALFIYAWIMMGLSMSLFDFLMVVRTDMKACNKRNMDG